MFDEGRTESGAQRLHHEVRVGKVGRPGAQAEGKLRQVEVVLGGQNW